jgi:large subunit ribosomal protein L6
MMMTKLTRVMDEQEVPKGISAEFKDSVLMVKGPQGTLTRTFFHPRIKMTVSKGKIAVETRLASLKEKALVGTWAAHARNMIKGVQQPYTYRMKAVYAHFPVKMTLKGNELIIENFLGERHPRKASILGGTKVTIKGQELELVSISLEEVGQTAANIENATRIRNRDPRVFQDGIYITSKGE